MPRLTEQNARILRQTMRRDIREKCAAMFAAEGSPSMDELAAALNIAKGTLYNYYHDKEELLQDVLIHSRNQMYERMEQEITDDLPADRQLLIYARIMLEDFSKNRYLRMESFRKNIMVKHFHSRGLDLIENILKKGTADGLFRDIDAQETAVFIFCSLVGRFRYTLRHNVRFEVTETLDLFQDIVLRSLYRNPPV